ncbi:hypothetical protein [Halostagnicola sp. A-GB9-2]|nr:hypothetical protein [Halostagnicola sp. A-GB9-2]MDJ1434564.1 hypothetical protein [Halostagnicola sp. A-GB9-2]
MTACSIVDEDGVVQSACILMGSSLSSNGERPTPYDLNTTE